MVGDVLSSNKTLVVLLCLVTILIAKSQFKSSADIPILVYKFREETDVSSPSETVYASTDDAENASLMRQHPPSPPSTSPSFHPTSHPTYNQKDHHQNMNPAEGEPHHLKMLGRQGEINTFTKWIKQTLTGVEDASYFEFGAGGSTEIVLRNTKATVTSVDTSGIWLSKIKERAIELGCGERIRTRHMDFGLLGNFGYPKTEERKAEWPKYSQAIKEEPQANVVFIDGRFRVASTLAVILHTTNRPLIMFHDFTRRQAFYGVVLKYLKAVEVVGSLWVFRIKENVDLAQVQVHYDEYKLNPM